MTAVTGAEYKSEFENTKYTPYLALTGFSKEPGENWHRFNGTAIVLSMEILAPQRSL